MFKILSTKVMMNIEQHVTFKKINTNMIKTIKYFDFIL